ncbi:MAG TPA: hypothetical protein EYG03_04120 [Planctomycetes bacterium]|nr:hypothetical protein [Planctomycetota bacterium]
MKITAVETLVCHARMRHWVFVKVVTDQTGLFGWGEATLASPFQQEVPQRVFYADGRVGDWQSAKLLRLADLRFCSLTLRCCVSDTFTKWKHNRCHLRAVNPQQTPRPLSRWLA